MKNDYKDEKEAVCALLKNMGLSGFSFHTDFELRFTRDGSAEFNGMSLPNQICVSIMSDWWFGDKKEWDDKVARLMEGINYPEPSEPVLSYELTILRWSNGSLIKSVTFTEDYILILFECGKSISICSKGNGEDEYSWLVSSYGNEPCDDWYIRCEREKIFLDITKKQTKA